MDIIVRAEVRQLVWDPIQWKKNIFVILIKIEFTKNGVGRKKDRIKYLVCVQSKS